MDENVVQLCSVLPNIDVITVAEAASAQENINRDASCDVNIEQSTTESQGSDLESDLSEATIVAIETVPVIENAPSNSLVNGFRFNITQSKHRAHY